MGIKSGIEWTDASWGPWRGCSKVSEGCQNCYAEREMTKYGKDFNTVTRAARQTFEAPLHWKEPKKIMVCPWSDFFHPDADSWRFEALDIIGQCPQHTFIVVTKRPERMVECLYGKQAHDGMTYGFGYLCQKSIIPNVWLLVTAENQHRADKRIPELVKIRQYGNWPVLGVSIEPMLGELDLGAWLFRHYPCERCGAGWKYNIAERGINFLLRCPNCRGEKVVPRGNETYSALDWVIIGAESGSDRRPCNLDWVRRVRDDCKAANVPLFIKQLHIDGKLVKDQNLFPADLRIREMPCSSRTRP